MGKRTRPAQIERNFDQSYPAEISGQNDAQRTIFAAVLIPQIARSRTSLREYEGKQPLTKGLEEVHLEASAASPDTQMTQGRGDVT